MGYFLNSILIKNESDFEKVEQLYHSMVYKDYEALKRKDAKKIYDTVSIKYFPLAENSAFCIYDENNVEMPSAAKNLSCKINEDVISMQIFDSDELNVKVFRNGKEIAALYKNHEEYKIEGELSCIHADKEKCLSVLSEDYTFMEDCAQKLFPEEFVFPEEKIAGQKVVKYRKEILIPLENEKLPEFDSYCRNDPDPESKQFYIAIVNQGRKSKGLLVLLRGSAIEKQYVKIGKAYVNTGLFRARQEDALQCAEADVKKAEGETYLIFRFNDFEFPAGYSKEALDSLFKSNNMSLYRKGLEYRLKSIITISFDCEVSEIKGEIEAFAYPAENLEDSYAYFKMDLSEQLQNRA